MLKTISDRLKSFESMLGKRVGTDLSYPGARRRAYLHFHLVDHGILRTFWTNLHEISPGIWRSNQPSPRRLHRYKKTGIVSVLNLRGENLNSPYLLEKEACDAVGLTLRSQALSARQLVSQRILLALLDNFETLERPFVMHCKSGADRAGLAAALYLLHIEGAPITTAKKQLSFKFLHFRSFHTGILDHMLGAYEADNAKNPMPIRKWLETRYDAKKLTAEFDAKRGRS